MFKKRDMICLGVGIFFILIYSSLTLAAGEQLYKGSLHSGDKITEKNTSFSFFFEKPINYVTLKTEDTSSLLIEKGKCMLYKSFNVCFISTNFSFLNKTINLDIFSAQVEIYDNTALLNLTRTFSSDVINSQEAIDVDIVLSNSGAMKAEKIKFYEQYPEKLLIKDVEGCNILDNKIFWNGSLKTKETLTCSYSVEALNPVNYSSLATVIYDDGFETIKFNSTKIDLTVTDHVLIMSAKITPSILILGYDAHLNINLSYKGNETKVKVTNFLISSPWGIPITNVKTGENITQFTWKGSVVKNKSTAFLFDIITNDIGYYNIEVNLTYEENGILKENIQKIPINITLTGIDFNFRSENKSFSPGGTMKAEMEVKNLNKFVNFEDVSVSFVGEPFGLAEVVREIGYLPSLEKRFREFSVPIDPRVEPGNYTFEVVLNHYWNGKLLKEKIDLELNIFGDANLTKVTPDPEPKVNETLESELVENVTEVVEVVAAVKGSENEQTSGFMSSLSNVIMKITGIHISRNILMISIVLTLVLLALVIIFIKVVSNKIKEAE